MKNYIRPSVEVSKFDVADIITASGIVAPIDELKSISPEAATLYEQYQTAGGSLENAAVFQW